MKKLLILLAICLLVGCNEFFEYHTSVIFVIEGCEYITVKGLYGFCHKGNCSNPIHVYGGQE